MVHTVCSKIVYTVDRHLQVKDTDTGNIVIFVQVVFVYVDGVRLSVGNATTNGHIVHPPDDI
jgi:hypothetical protein